VTWANSSARPPARAISITEPPAATTARAAASRRSPAAVTRKRPISPAAATSTVAPGSARRAAAIVSVGPRASMRIGPAPARAASLIPEQYQQFQLNSVTKSHFNF
jgi:hypothetical protein